MKPTLVIGILLLTPLWIVAQRSNVNVHEPRLPQMKREVKQPSVIVPTVKPINEQTYPVPLHDETIKDTIFYEGQKEKIELKRSTSGDEFLERLPGFTIAGDGTISYMGMPFRKLRIDGVEIPPDSYLSVLQTLRMGRISTVEVFYDETETARRSGVFDGQWDRTLNILTKPPTRQETNADILAAYGSAGRYELRGSGAYTRGQNKYQLNAASTNTNTYAYMDRVDFVNKGIPYTGEVDRQNASFQLQNRLSNTATGMGSILFNNAWYGGEVESHRMELYSSKLNYMETLSDQKANLRDLGANYTFAFVFDPKNRLEVTPTLNYGKQYTQRNDSTDQFELFEQGDSIDYLVYNTRALDRLDKDNLVGELGVEYTHQFTKPGRKLSIRVGGRFNTVWGNGSTRSLQMKYLMDEIEIDRDTAWIKMDTLSKSNRDYVVSEQNNTFNGSITYNEPLFHPQNSLQFVYSGSNSRNETSRTTQLWDYTKNEYVTDSSGCRRNVYHLLTQSFSLNYQIDRETMNLLFGMKGELNGSENESYELGKKPDFGLGQYLFNLSPNLRFSYRMGKRGELTAEYTGVTIQPTNQQLLRVVDRNDPRRVVVGNPNLKPAYRHTARVVYSRTGNESKSSLTAEAVLHMTEDQMVNRDRYDSITKQSRLTWMNVDGVWDVQGRVTYNVPYRNKRFGLLLKGDALFARNEISINNKPDVYYGTTVNGSATQRFRLDGLMEVGLKASVNYFHVTNTEETAFNRNTFDLSTGCYLSMTLPLGIGLQSDYKLINSFGYFEDVIDLDSSDEDFTRSIWNMTLNKSFLKKNRATVTVKWNDILGQFTPYYRSYNNNILEDRYYNSIVCSYLLFSFAYKW